MLPLLNNTKSKQMATCLWRPGLNSPLKYPGTGPKNGRGQPSAFHGFSVHWTRPGGRSPQHQDPDRGLTPNLQRPCQTLLVSIAWLLSPRDSLGQDFTIKIVPYMPQNGMAFNLYSLAAHMTELPSSVQSISRAGQQLDRSEISNKIDNMGQIACKAHCCHEPCFQPAAR